MFASRDLLSPDGKFRISAMLAPHSCNKTWTREDGEHIGQCLLFWGRNYSERRLHTERLLEMAMLLQGWEDYEKTASHPFLAMLSHVVTVIVGHAYVQVKMLPEKR